MSGALACSAAFPGVAFVSYIQIKTRATCPHVDRLLTLSTGCWATWCPCVVFNKNKQRLQSLQTQGAPLPGGGETFDAGCVIYGWLAANGVGWIMQVCSDVNQMRI